MSSTVGELVEAQTAKMDAKKAAYVALVESAVDDRPLPPNAGEILDGVGATAEEFRGRVAIVKLRKKHREDLEVADRLEKGLLVEARRSAQVVDDEIVVLKTAMNVVHQAMVRVAKQHDYEIHNFRECVLGEIQTLRRRGWSYMDRIDTELKRLNEASGDNQRLIADRICDMLDETLDVGNALSLSPPATTSVFDIVAAAILEALKTGLPDAQSETIIRAFATAAAASSPAGATTG